MNARIRIGLSGAAIGKRLPVPAALFDLRTTSQSRRAGRPPTAGRVVPAITLSMGSGIWDVGPAALRGGMSSVGPMTVETLEKRK
jgi:hypothetical protein